MKSPQTGHALHVWPLQDSEPQINQNVVEISKIQLIMKLLNVESHPLAGPAHTDLDGPKVSKNHCSVKMGCRLTESV